MNVESKLIVFEGIDNSGKTSISKAVHKLLSEDSMVAFAFSREEDSDSDFYKSQTNWWSWSKEPIFSTEEADALNDSENPITEEAREALFLTSRMKRQSSYKTSSVVLDRYLWTGMAYAKVFSPSCFEFCKELYGNTNLDVFKTPTLTFFIDTPVETCQAREPDGFSAEQLTEIRDAFIETKPLAGEVVTIENTGTLEEAVAAVMAEIKSRFFGSESERAGIDVDFPATMEDMQALRKEQEESEEPTAEG